MSAMILPAHVTSPEAVRRLVVSALIPQAGIAEIIDGELPCTGNPLLALDQSHRPLIVSIHPDNPAQALLQGLAAWEDIQRNCAWLTRLHPLLSPEHIRRELQLLVLTHAPPPGADCLNRMNCPIMFSTFRIVRVNGETGVLIEPIGRQPATPMPGPADAAGERDLPPGVEFTEEEKSFFEAVEE